MKNTSKKPMDKKSMTITWVIIAAIMAYAVANDGEAIIPAVGTMAIVSVILALVVVSNKKAAQKGPEKAQSARPEPVKSPAAERTTAQRLRGRRGFWITVAVASAVIFAILPKELLADTIRFFSRHGFERGFRFLMRAEPGRLIGFAIFAGLALLCLIGVLRALALSRRIAREPDNIPAARPERSRPAERAKAEEAISCAHVNGREKYIQQLDSYLRAGLIDKAEYRALKERYSKLDIPDDYH